MGVKIPTWIMSLSCGVFSTVTIGYLNDALDTMIPWLLAMLGVVVADLVAGLRKSLKLGIHISWSMAFRNTMGKMVTYVAFVMMVAMIETACGHQYRIAMWGCLFICLLEGGSILSNLVKPYGIDVTPTSILEFAVRLFSQKVIKVEGEDFHGDEHTMDEIKERERGRWEKRRPHPNPFPTKGEGDD